MFNSKRSRATYEADLHDGAAVHVAFGTPLPSLDADTRDDGSYIPLHKQEVRDDKGRRRLHGAFTGGWSAGYFNTVGSKEGWTPSTFVSSRTARRKDDPRAPDQRPEDYMDDEDLADAAATKEIRTTDPFGALGAPLPGQRLSGGLASLMRIQGDTIGLKLLRKMGWKDGQGIGPRIRRVARLDISGGNTPHVAEKTHMFAPENINMVSFIQKSDQQGLGFNDDDDARISRISSSGSAWAHHTASGNHRNEVTRAGNGIYEGEDDGPASGLNVLLGISEKRKSKHGQRGGLGVGVLNDTGSDEDDPYEMGPRISYNRVLGGEKTKKKKKLAATSVSANPSLGSTPVFVSRAAHTTKSRGQGRCGNGKRPLNGFVPGQLTNSKSTGNSTDVYPPPSVPPEWAPSRSNSSLTFSTNTSTAEAAKAAKLDPNTRAAILGESTLPGKSVFDYMSAASRERLAIASGKTDLPPAKGEAPIEARGPAEQQLQERIRTLPCLQKDTALAALSRGASTGSPYANDDAKRGRYRLYLQSAAGFGGSPIKPSDMTDDDFVKEIGEFYGCAQLFKPMTGFMATRFTTASAGSKQLTTSSGSELATDLGVRKATAAPAHLGAAEEAARMGISSAVAAAGSSVAAPAYAPTSSVISGDEPASSSFDQALTDTKRGLTQDKKGAAASKDDDTEPPPAYSEGPSPLQSFTFLMATAGGASSIITQVQQGGPPINAIGDVGADETISMDLRGTRFVLSRDELLTLPEFVLLSLFPNGLFPEGHMGGFAEGDAVQVDYDPASLQYMLDFFRTVAQSIPAETSPSVSQEENASAADAMESRDDSSKRAGIIVLREDLDFYVIPPRADITQSEMLEVKRAAGKALLQQNGIFSGLKRSDEPGTTEAHLIEMLTAGGFNHDDSWGHRAGEPNKAVVCSLALARLRSDIRGNDMGSNAVGMAQKLLLFWRKPARRCWWEGVELENVEGVPGKLKVWIRRVWTLEMSVIGLR
ncbi:G patch domain-containing protein 1 [Colletotrichum viniferum]|nr:G patch domain-containing protein 1 [Colletotrichum viniferum]